MRYRGGLVCSLMLLALGAGALLEAPGEAIARAPRTCGSIKHRTIAANSVARVYRAFNADRAVTETVGCFSGKHRRVVFGFQEEMREFLVTHTALSGRFAGAFQQYAGRGGAFLKTRVFDLRSGRRIFEVGERQENGPDGQPVNSPYGRALVLNRSGAAAWTVERVGLTTGRVATTEVHIFDAAGARLVDTGPEIDARSLALGGSTVYWTHDGQARSIELG